MLELAPGSPPPAAGLAAAGRSSGVVAKPQADPSLGAGVDHFLCDPRLPRAVPIARLVDPYMADAMSEYVALQVLRLHRRDLEYRAQRGLTPIDHAPSKPFCNSPSCCLGIVIPSVLGTTTKASLSLFGESPRFLGIPRISALLLRQGHTCDHLY
jgi:hypothetical protein